MKEKRRSFDTGFNVKVSENHGRLIMPDGNFNTHKKGISWFSKNSIYDILIEMPWWKFMFWLLFSYFILTLIFTGVYMSFGHENIQGIVETTHTRKWMEVFFFSAQTLTTVGYGRLNPVGFPAGFTAMLESMTGVLGFAMATGLLYGRFSRPKTKLIFSRYAVVAPYKEITGWMFRFANMRENQLIELEIQIIVSIIKKVNHAEVREFFGLNLERTKVNFFPTSWTVVHPIDSDSPFYNLDELGFRELNPEFLILIKGYDDICLVLK